MCGIVGLHLKNPSLEPRLGELLSPMLAAMTTRGPDSAGIALYSDGLAPGKLKYSVREPAPGYDFDGLAERLGGELGEPVRVQRKPSVTMLVSSADPVSLHTALLRLAPEVAVVGFGRTMEIYKDVGEPAAICERYGVSSARGYQGVGHTRMATESAVTTEHSHPFAAGADLVLVHNGSFSNHATLRRRLADEGVAFDTDNDSEVAARYIAEQMRRGSDLGDAMRMVLKEFDGFFTLLVATENEFAIVRDAFACKPAVLAETDDYVAMSSEYHAMAGLPGIEKARVFEPMPEEVHVWSR